MSRTAGSKNKSLDEQLENEFAARSGRGRTKGAQNKLTRTAKETIQQCADLMARNGKTLYKWVDKSDANEKAFWCHIYPKLLPLQVTGEGGGAVVVALTSTDAKL